MCVKYKVCKNKFATKKNTYLSLRKKEKYSYVFRVECDLPEYFQQNLDTIFLVCGTNLNITRNTKSSNEEQIKIR